jgi:hypothetical protein
MITEGGAVRAGLQRTRVRHDLLAAHDNQSIEIAGRAAVPASTLSQRLPKPPRRDREPMG